MIDLDRFKVIFEILRWLFFIFSDFLINFKQQQKIETYVYWDSFFVDFERIWEAKLGPRSNTHRIQKGGQHNDQK